ncbi:hypothetical protein SH139x_002215 [Planctomycetaceae bacterium SH139]
MKTFLLMFMIWLLECNIALASPPWSFGRLASESDVIAIVQYKSSSDVEPTSDYSDGVFQQKLTIFKVLSVLKKKQGLEFDERTIAVAHFWIPKGVPTGGSFDFFSFNESELEPHMSQKVLNKKGIYLLYLKVNDSGEFVPVRGQSHALGAIFQVSEFFTVHGLQP